MLDTTCIAELKLENSGNATILKLVTAINKYNMMARSTVSLQKERLRLGELLYQVIYWGTAYITSKPPCSGKGTSASRIQGLIQLMQNADAEAAALKIKMLRGNLVDAAADAPKKDNEWLTRNSCFWLEAVDPKHRHGMNLSLVLQDWLNDPVSIAQKKSFWEYADGKVDPAEVEYINNARFGVHFKQAKMYDSSDALVEATADDDMIYVCDLDWNLYLHVSIKGTFHHSSFLSGKPIRGAGGIVVRAGVVKHIDANSGHYWTTPELMKELVNRFWQIPDSATIIPNAATEKCYLVGDFRKVGENATEVDIHGKKIVAEPPKPAKPEVQTVWKTQLVG